MLAYFTVVLIVVAKKCYTLPTVFGVFKQGKLTHSSRISWRVLRVPCDKKLIVKMEFFKKKISKVISPPKIESGKLI